MSEGGVLVLIAVALTVLKVVKRAYVERSNLIAAGFSRRRERWLLLFAYTHELMWYVVAAGPFGWSPLEAGIAYAVLKGLYALLSRVGEFLAESTMALHGYGVLFIRILWLAEAITIACGYAILLKVDPLPGNGSDPRWIYVVAGLVCTVVVYHQLTLIRWLMTRQKQIVGVFPGGPRVLLNTTLSAMRTAGPVAPGAALQAVAEYLLYWPVHLVILYPHQGAIRRKREGRQRLVEKIRVYSATIRRRARRKR